MDSKFAIFGQERAGTTSLIAALNKNDRIVHEPLSCLTGDLEHNPRYAKIIEQHSMNPDDLPESKIFPFLINSIIFLKTVICFGLFLIPYLKNLMGLSMYGVLCLEPGNEHFLEYCVAHGIKIIFQYRESSFYPAISWQLANQVQVWQLGEDKEHKSKVDSFEYQELEEPPIKRPHCLVQKVHTLLSFITTL